MSIAMPAQPTADQHHGWTPGPSGRVRDTSVDQRTRNYAMAIHLVTLIVSAVASPLIALVVVIIMWQTRRTDTPFIDDHGRETVNAIISYLIWSILLFWTIVVPIIVLIVGVVSLIRATIAASEGEYFRYPLTIRIL